MQRRRLRGSVQVHADSTDGPTLAVLDPLCSVALVPVRHRLRLIAPSGSAGTLEDTSEAFSLALSLCTCARVGGVEGMSER